MPGGVGTVSEMMILAGTKKDRVVARVKNANEIFFNLDSRRVYFDRADSFLYFVESPACGLVKRTIDAIFCETGIPPLVEQLHLDAHRFFTGARRIRLDADQVQPVLIALRLAGVRATIR